MKKFFNYALVTAIAFTGIGGFTACSSDDDAVVNNPNYNPETNEVTAKFVFNVSSGNTPTRMSAVATQATGTETFRGIDNAVLFSAKQGDDGKHLAAATTMDKRFDLSRIISPGSIDQNDSHRVIETSLPLNTNTLLFYGRATAGTASATEAAAGFSAYDLYGHLEKYDIGDDDESLNLSSTTFELSSRISDRAADFRKVEELLAGIFTCIMNTNLSGANHTSLSAERYTFDVAEGDYPATLSWADYDNANGKSPVETTHVLYPLEVKMGDAYREMTTIKQAQGELRAGYGEAILETAQSLWSVINEVRCATPFSKAEAVAKYMAERAHERIKQYFNGMVPSNGKEVTDVTFESTQNIIAHYLVDTAWPSTADARPASADYYESVKNTLFANFPQKNYHVPVGATHYEFNKDKKQFVYVQNYNTIAVGGTGGFTVESYYYPAELLYFGNSAIRVSNSENKAENYPKTVADWQDNTKWGTGWTANSHVVSSTQSVAMQNNINYGTSLLKTTVSYGATVLKDNNHAIQYEKDHSISATDEPDNEITVTGTSFQLVGVLIGGQSKKVGWDFIPVTTGNTLGYVYDCAINEASSIPATGTSAPNYTLVFDNYNTTAAANNQPQDKVYVALELVNNTGRDFFGEHNLIRNGGTFYLIGELDPNKQGLANLTWPTSHPLPPYNADGTSIQTKRVFMQDFMTAANFVIGQNSLKHAFMTVPDLRYSALTMGLSVDINWSTGLNFGDVILGESTSN